MDRSKIIYDILIWVVSVLVPIVVALLLFMKWDYDQLVFDMRIPNSDPIILLENLPIAKPLTFLPPIYATINGLTAILLVLAVYYIKNGKRKIHESLIKVCIALSLSFLVMYIAYHLTTDPTSFGGSGLISYLYFFILITHILLSIVVIPLVLISYSRAIKSKFILHKKIAKITFPIWLYVATTGVVVYLMISPYYA
jgi:putative membrane protein|tara:strand:+ start:1882 stop:2472 length:591 start_codon:yes stop_codon:yes gene_type:complete